MAVCLVSLEGYSSDLQRENPRLLKPSDRPVDRKLLVKKIVIDRPGLKARGEIVLKSLQPLTATLHFQQARGDPHQLFRMIERISGRNDSAGSFFSYLDSSDLTLHGVTVTITREGYLLGIDRVVLPEGRVENISGWVDQKEHWLLSTGILQLSRIPLRLNSKQAIESIPVRYDSLQASGTQSEYVSLRLEKMIVSHLPHFSDPKNFFSDVLRSMGFEQGINTTPLSFERFETTVVANEEVVMTPLLRLAGSGGGVLTGKISLPWKEPGRVYLDLTVVDKQQVKKRFQTVMP